MNDRSGPTMLPTGERMVPESAVPGTFWEHIYRYRFAAKYVKGKRVLDIASGEGYGLAAFQALGAREVVGVDISEEACAHARAKYKLDIRVGSAETIPLETGSVDVVTSFETIEHVQNPDRFLEECRRVLRPGGLIVLSTPLRETYGTQNENEYHISEMTEQESRDLLTRYFPDMKFWAQRPHTIMSWKAGAEAGDGGGVRARKIWDNFWARISLRLGHSNLYTTKNWCDRPADAIGSSTGMLRPLNPYRIRPRNRFGLIGPQYLIAVGTNGA